MGTPVATEAVSLLLGFVFKSKMVETGGLQLQSCATGEKVLPACDSL